jgi:hypothetical protein
VDGQVVLTDDAGRCIGYADPGSAPLILERVREMMSRAIRDANARGLPNPLPRSTGIRPGWSLHPNASLEAGHSLLYAPRAEIWGPDAEGEADGEDENEDDEGPESWEVVSVDGQIGLFWRISLTPDGLVIARPYLLSDVRLIVFDAPGAPATLHLGRLNLGPSGR